MDISFTTTPRQDAAIQYMTNIYNGGGRFSLTPLQFLKNAINGILDSWTLILDENQQTNKGKLYQKASPVDQLAIDAILEKYK